MKEEKKKIVTEFNEFVKELEKKRLAAGKKNDEQQDEEEGLARNGSQGRVEARCALLQKY